MKYKSVFHLLASIIKKEKIQAVLIGGFALNYYNVARQTIDLDFLITREDFNKILNLLQEHNYKLIYDEEIFARLKTETDYLFDIDFLFVENETIKKIIKQGKKIILVGQKFIIPCIEHLIALKLHAVKNNPSYREYKDLPDIINLIKFNNIDIKNSEFKQLCLKYGTEKIYKKILKIINNG